MGFERRLACSESRNLSNSATRTMTSSTRSAPSSALNFIFRPIFSVGGSRFGLWLVLFFIKVRWFHFPRCLRLPASNSDVPGAQAQPPRKSSSAQRLWKVTFSRFMLFIFVFAASTARFMSPGPRHRQKPAGCAGSRRISSRAASWLLDAQTSLKYLEHHQKHSKARRK